MLKRRSKVLKFKVGDKVHIRNDALVRHARSVPAHLGYTTNQFAWRAALNKYANQTGKITMVFDSGHVNLTFRDGNTIGIDQDELVKGKR